MKKRLFILSLLLVFGTFIKVNASEFDTRYNSLEEYLNGPEYYTEDYQNELALDDLSRGITMLDSTDYETPTQKTIAITGHQQLYNYYCGPATAQIIIQYDTGTLYSQDTLANYMGTNTSGTYVYQLRNGLNHYSNKTYVYRLASSYPIFTYLYSNINNNKLVVLNMRMSYVNSSYSYNYSHYVVGCGYYLSATGSATTNQIYYYDPYSPYLGYHWTTEYNVVQGTVNNNGYYIC